MSSFQHNPGYGTLFVNDRKRGKAPDLKGSGCCPHCQEQFDIAGWDEERNGKQRIQLKLEEPYEGGGERGARPQPARQDDRRGSGYGARTRSEPQRRRPPGDDAYAGDDWGDEPGSNG